MGIVERAARALRLRAAQAPAVRRLRSMFVHKASASLMNTALARSFVDFGAGHSLPLVTPVCLHTIAVKAAQGGKPRPP